MATLSDRLMQLRAERNILKKGVFTAVVHSVMAYYRYERNERQPTADILIALADFFDVSLDYLVGRSDDPVRR